MIRHAVDDAMKELPVQDKQLVKLAYFGGLSNREIAAVIIVAQPAAPTRPAAPAPKPVPVHAARTEPVQVAPPKAMSSIPDAKALQQKVSVPQVQVPKVDLPLQLPPLPR